MVGKIIVSVLIIIYTLIVWYYFMNVVDLDFFGKTIKKKVRQTTTDKQIIIDGVDVAKCRCFTSEWNFNNCGHICKGTECKYKRLWYKKQLKRKEQENEELIGKI